MNDIKDTLRQRHDLDRRRDQVAAATGVSTGTVSHVLERAVAAGAIIARIHSGAATM